MVQIITADKENVLLLTEGYVPRVDHLRCEYPGIHRYHEDPKHTPADSDEEAAWTITAYAQTLAARRGYQIETDPPMETWMIAPPTTSNAKLADWFVGIPDDSYRLMVHRSPQPRAPDRDPGLVWGRVYDRLEIRHRSGAYKHLRASALNLLTDLLGAYQGSHDDRVAVLDATGHRFTHSAGLKT